MRINNGLNSISFGISKTRPTETDELAREAKNARFREPVHVDMRPPRMTLESREFVEKLIASMKKQEAAEKREALVRKVTAPFKVIGKIFSKTMGR